MKILVSHEKPCEKSIPGVYSLFCRFVLFSQDVDANAKDNTKKLSVTVKFETDLEVTG